MSNSEPTFIPNPREYSPVIKVTATVKTNMVKLIAPPGYEWVPVPPAIQFTVPLEAES